MKLWQSKDEWTHYINCDGSIDHILPPERGEEDADKPVADVARVRHICDGCRVRPECIKWATDPKKPEGSIWVAGKWIPDNKRQARRVRLELTARLPAELEARGEDV